jgi:hypothetical protein
MKGLSPVVSRAPTACPAKGLKMHRRRPGPCGLSEQIIGASQQDFLTRSGYGRMAAGPRSHKTRTCRHLAGVARVETVRPPTERKGAHLRLGHGGSPIIPSAHSYRLPQRERGFFAVRAIGSPKVVRSAALQCPQGRHQKNKGPPRGGPLRSLEKRRVLGGERWRFA